MDGLGKIRSESWKELQRYSLEPGGVARRMIVNGYNLLTSSIQSNAALFVAALAPWDERDTPQTGIRAIIGHIFGIGTHIPEATVIPLYYDFQDVPLLHWDLLNTYWALILPQIGQSVAFGTSRSVPFALLLQH